MLGPFLIVLYNMLKSIGWLDYSDTKIGGIQYRVPIWWRSRGNFILYSVTFLRWINWKYINVTESSFEKQTEEEEAHSCTECSKTLWTSRGLQLHFFFHNTKKKIFTLLIMRLSYPKLNWKTLFSKARALFE